mgnify:CR=1 FL=1
MLGDFNPDVEYWSLPNMVDEHLTGREVRTSFIFNRQRCNVHLTSPVNGRPSCYYDDSTSTYEIYVGPFSDLDVVRAQVMERFIAADLPRIANFSKKEAEEYAKTFTEGYLLSKMAVV